MRRSRARETLRGASVVFRLVSENVNWLDIRASRLSIFLTVTGGILGWKIVTVPRFECINLLDDARPPRDAEKRLTHGEPVFKATHVGQDYGRATDSLTECSGSV